jgi:hypothetical protein
MLQKSEYFQQCAAQQLANKHLIYFASSLFYFCTLKKEHKQSFHFSELLLRERCARSAFLNRRVATRQRVVELLFSNFEKLNSPKVAKKSQLWVVETFFQNTGRGTIWVEKRCAR